MVIWFTFTLPPKMVLSVFTSRSQRREGLITFRAKTPWSLKWFQFLPGIQWNYFPLFLEPPNITTKEEPPQGWSRQPGAGCVLNFWPRFARVLGSRSRGGSGWEWVLVSRRELPWTVFPEGAGPAAGVLGGAPIPAPALPPVSHTT